MILRACVAMVSLVAITASAEPFPEIELGIGMYRIVAEVAATDATRRRGLMLRENMPAHRGMLFVFPEARIECMWMKNTLLPLSVAFIDEKGTIVNVETMAPKTLDSHCSAKPVRFALEMNVGWFKQKGFGPGTQLRGLDKAPLAR